MADTSGSTHTHCSRVLHTVRATIAALLPAHVRPAAGGGEGARPRLLDVGCWEGEATALYGAALRGAELHGIEVFPEPAAVAAARGVTVAALDLERDGWPYPDAHFDAVVCNQVLEHLKNIWLPLDEMARVTRPGGTLVVSVPNLASLHNRVLLALGRQPTSIRVVGPHVRGFALHEFVRVLERGGRFEVVEVRGVGFPPLPVWLGGWVAALWKGACHTPVVVCRRTAEVVGGEGVRGEGDHQTYYG
jgi:SAM-dependent methyltransferase